MGGKDVTPKDDIVETPQDKQALNEARKQRSRFNFEMVGIDKGTILQFKKDHSITCQVVNDTQVDFRGEITSLSNSALIILHEMGYDWKQVQGPACWCFNGIFLSELRGEL